MLLGDLQELPCVLLSADGRLQRRTGWVSPIKAARLFLPQPGTFKCPAFFVPTGSHSHHPESTCTQVWFTLNSPIFIFFIYKAVTSQNGKSAWKHCVKDLMKSVNWYISERLINIKEITFKCKNGPIVSHNHNYSSLRNSLWPWYFSLTLFSLNTHSLSSLSLSLSLHNVFALQGDLHFDDDSNFGQEYKRLKQAMEMVGFLASTKKQYV